MSIKYCEWKRKLKGIYEFISFIWIHCNVYPIYELTLQSCLRLRRRKICVLQRFVRFSFLCECKTKKRFYTFLIEYFLFLFGMNANKTSNFKTKSVLEIYCEWKVCIYYKYIKYPVCFNGGHIIKYIIYQEKNR